MRKGGSFRSILYIFTALVILVDMFFSASFTSIEETVSIKLQGLGFKGTSFFLSYIYLHGPMILYFFWYYSRECFRPRFYYEMLHCFTGICIIPVLKIIVGQGRPFMVSTKIDALDCECDYGMPSGHSFAATLMAMLLAKRLREALYPDSNRDLEAVITEPHMMSDYSPSRMSDEMERSLSPNMKTELVCETLTADLMQKKSMQMGSMLQNIQSKTKTIVWICTLVFLTLSALLISISRITLGAHSLTQACIGMLLGILYSDYYFIYFYQSKIREFSRMFFLTYKNKYHRKYLLAKRLIYVPMINLIILIAYLSRLSYPPNVKISWLTESIKGLSSISLECQNMCRDHKSFEFKDLTDCLFINLYLLFCIVMSLRRKEAYRYDPLFYHNQSWKLIIIRNTCLIASLSVSLLPYYLAKRYSPHSDLPAIAGRSLFGFLFPGFLLVAIPALHRKYKLDQGGELI